MQQAKNLIKNNAVIDIANLITNNQELLEACKMVVQYVDGGTRVESYYSKMCRKAILKAEGEKP